MYEKNAGESRQNLPLVKIGNRWINLSEVRRIDSLQPSSGNPGSSGPGGISIPSMTVFFAACPDNMAYTFTGAEAQQLYNELEKLNLHERVTDSAMVGERQLQTA